MRNLLCINNNHIDPYFNLAAEEYLLKNFSKDIFMLYRNEPSIIVGKHQNALAEINMDFVRSKKIKVVRRLSGGGTVFHDLGNLNFTFIVSGEEGKLVDFRRFTQPILDVLAKLGVEAKFEGRNDLTIDGRKISGNAEHIWRNRTLHHGTLLFSSVMEDLSGALKVNPLKFTDKAVKSIRSRVTNISEHIPVAINVVEFRNHIMDHIRITNGNSGFYNFNSKDILEIEKLSDEKYSRWDWNFGYSPKYRFENLIRTPEGNIEFQIDVEKGYIHNIKISGTCPYVRKMKEVEKALTGIRHDPEHIRNCLHAICDKATPEAISFDELADGMF